MLKSRSTNSIHTVAYNVDADSTGVAGTLFIRLAVVASKICEIPRNCRKIRTYTVQGYPRSSMSVSIESALKLCNFQLVI